MQLSDLPTDLRVEAIHMLRAIRYAGPDYPMSEFLSAHVEQVQETGLFTYSIEEGNVISEQGLRILAMFDPKPRA